MRTGVYENRCIWCILSFCGFTAAYQGGLRFVKKLKKLKIKKIKKNEYMYSITTYTT